MEKKYYMHFFTMVHFKTESSGDESGYSDQHSDRVQTTRIGRDTRGLYAGLYRLRLYVT